MTTDKPDPELTAPGTSPRCVAHLPCDWCSVCQRGRCCRRDNPLYELPHEGEWQPFVGRLGVLTTDGDRVECHVCGGYYDGLGIHVYGAHDLLAVEYRALFGLRASTGLAGAHLRAVQRRNRERRVAAGTFSAGISLALWTTEQRGQAAKGRRISREERNQRADPAYRAPNREKDRDRHATARAANPEGVNAAKRALYAANPEKYRAAQRARDAAGAGREKKRARAKAYYAANREKVDAARRAWRVANPEKYAAQLAKQCARYAAKHERPTDASA